MTPQSSFLYAAPVMPGREAELRAVLGSMNRTPGVVDLENPLIPFAKFESLHFARLLIVCDLAAADRAVYGLPVEGLPDYLVFMGEVDGEEPDFRAELVRRSSHGLKTLFAHCSGFRREMDLSAFLQQSLVPPGAAYVNWVGRTVRQEREEEALRRALVTFSEDKQDALCALPPQQLWVRLKSFVAEQQATGSLTLTPTQPTPFGWWLRNFLNLVFVPVALLLLTPFLLLYLPVYLIQLRHWETTDPASAPPLAPAHSAELEAMENYDVTNQFSVFGSLKPGLTRLWSMRFFLWITDYTARHIFNRGGLARVSTIHFARWIPFDGGKRMLFSSIYDGSLESYMDDFINKVGYGLNITFSNGIGYPRTRWLVFDGCQDEQTFKRVLRRHQLPTDVWYNAVPGVTAANKHRNGMIRTGIEAASMTDDGIREWAALL
ncbi:MAG TPA: hypothetical protein VGN16_22295 [Acidobacteriaceae bacterium]|jgi:hypothetical protein